MTRKKIPKNGMKTLRGYTKTSYREQAILDYLSQGLTYPQIARETNTRREDVAKSVIAMCNKVGGPNPKALVSGYIAWVEG